MKIKNVHGAPILLSVITVLMIAVHFIDVSFLAVGSGAYLSIAVLQLLVIATPSAIYARARGRKFISHMRLRLFKSVDIPLMIFALGVMLFGGATLNYYFYTMMPQASAASSSSVSVASGVEGVTDVLYAVFAAGVIPAITEEFLFRGIVLAEYERNGTALAVILSALTFSFLHFSLVRIPVYFFYGVMLSLMC